LKGNICIDQLFEGRDVIKNLQKTLDEKCRFNETSEKTGSSAKFSLHFVAIFSSFLYCFIIIAWLITWKVCYKVKTETGIEEPYTIVKVRPRNSTPQSTSSLSSNSKNRITN
jgi:hypothetical protein